MSIFRAYDVRGIVNQTLTPAIVSQLGQAIGSEAISQGNAEIVVGRDGRLSGPSLSEALIEGLMKVGCQVIDIGLVPTPLLYFATYYLKTGNGVMITGSHNPPNYNGFKIVINEQALSGAAIQALKTRIEQQNFAQGQGSCHQADVHHAYISRVHKDVKLARPFKIVVDCGNGAAGIIAKHLFHALGCEVIELYCEVDGHFPHHHPDPSVPENLVDLREWVQEQQADLGIAFDGDGDRLGVVDAQGKIIWPDRQLILFATDILKRHPGASIIFDVKCTRYLPQIIREQGGEGIMWKTGHSLIKAKMKETGALLGGEMSGHLFFKERWYGFDDALYSAARLLEILSQDPRSPTEILATLPEAVSTPELKLELAEYGEHFALMQTILERFQFPEAEEFYRIDGLRVHFKQGWGLIRPSNTTPSLIIRFEADNASALSYIQAQFRQQFAQLPLDHSLTLPF